MSGRLNQIEARLAALEEFVAGTKRDRDKLEKATEVPSFTNPETDGALVAASVEQQSGPGETVQPETTTKSTSTRSKSST